MNFFIKLIGVISGFTLLPILIVGFVSKLVYEAFMAGADFADDAVDYLNDNWD